MSEVWEVWRAIPGFPDYEVSHLGNVRSWKNQNGRGQRPTEARLIKPVKMKDTGYYRVTLCVDGIKVNKRVHHLVLTAFICPRPEGCDGCHNDDDKSNNALYNLRWDTPESNVKDKIANGKQAKGEAVNSSKLNEVQVREIIATLPVWERGMGKMFAKKFGVSESAISYVKNEKTWRHV